MTFICKGILFNVEPCLNLRNLQNPDYVYPFASTSSTWAFGKLSFHAGNLHLPPDEAQAQQVVAEIRVGFQDGLVVLVVACFGEGN